MPNQVFKVVVEELDFVGDILAEGITKKAVIKEGSSPDEVTVREMKSAVTNHIVEALLDFVSEKKAKKWEKQILKKLNDMEG